MPAANRDERRKAAAERAKRYRERAKKQADPEAYAAEQAAEMAKREAETREAAARAEAEAAQLVQLTSQLTDALTVTVDLAADVVRAAAMAKTAPPFGSERARKVAEAWAPILAPYIAKSGLPHLPIIIASASTASAVAEWAGECRRAAEEAKKRQEAARPPKLDDEVTA